MSTSVLEAMEVETPVPVTPISLEELARRTGLILRPLTSAIIDELYDELERDDPDERNETLAYLMKALNETRAAVGARPMFPNE